ncbi:TNF receptor-associated factor 3 [Elysia marginata]|uniref:TNF receptor-associated factor 3 n=1 Tax=Elysia marginata TaxID=1093978 RepID=A0AAV4FTR5_9GAST|nr:TNF receptor-associated factor 3 [Elysia marginata]
MSDDVSSEESISGAAGRTTSDSIPFSQGSGSSSGNYSFPSGEDAEPVTYDEKYYCLVDNRLLKDPVQTSCGHRMCKDCVEKFLGEEQSKRCPANEEDCDDVRRDNVYPDPGFRREIKQLLVYCPNKSYGCPVKIKLGLLDAHIENDCPEAIVKCPYKCSKKLKRRQLEDHMQSCPKKPTECPYKSLGCKFEGTKEDVRNHAKDIETHFQVLISFTVEAEIEKRKASEELQNIAKKQEAVAAELNTIHRELRLKMMQQVERIMHLEQKVEEMEGSLRGLPQQIQPLHQSVEQLKSLIPQLANHDRQVASHEIRMAEMDLRFQMLETASYDGQLLWKIRDFSHRKRDAVQGRTVSLYSQPFYAGRFGYKMCARIYLNGDGIGRGTHMSLYFVVMKGEYDALLPWPFQHRVSLMLLDQSSQKRHLKDEFFPDPNSTSFRRPENAEMNVASGCPLFVAHTVLDNPNNQYVKDDTLFIKVRVDMSNLQPI